MLGTRISVVKSCFRNVSVEKDFGIINDTVAKFISNATRLGAVLVIAGNDVSMVSMEQQVFNRMDTATHNDVVVRSF